MSLELAIVIAPAILILGIFIISLTWHKHKYKVIQTIEVYETWDGVRQPGQNPTCYKYVLQCSECGNVKIRRTDN